MINLNNTPPSQPSYSTSTVRERVRLLPITPRLFILLTLIPLFLLSSCPQSKPKTESTPSQNENEQPASITTPLDYKSISDLWDTATALAKNAPNINYRTVCLTNITSDLLTSGRIDEALIVANDIEIDYLKIQSLGEISQYAIDKKQFDKAKKILDDLLTLSLNLQNPMEKLTVLKMISVQLNQIGDTEKAQLVGALEKNALDEFKKNPPAESTSTYTADEIIDAIETKIEKTKSLADNGDFLEALESLKELDDPSAQAVALAYIGQLMEQEKIPLTDEMKLVLRDLLNPQSEQKPQSQ